MNDFDKTLTDWLNYLETQRNRSPATIREYRRDLLTLQRHLLPPPRGGDRGGYLPSLQAEHGQVERLSDITTPHLAAYLVHLKHEHEYASATLGRKIASLKSFFSHAARA
jgi:site-specific recombinase XerD